MQLIETLTAPEATIQAKQPVDDAATLVLEFSGSLNTITTGIFFLENAGFFTSWLNQKLKKTVIDLRQVEYLNSMAIGHITQYCIALDKEQIIVEVVVIKGSEVHSILQFCGFFDLPGIRLQEMEALPETQP